MHLQNVFKKIEKKPLIREMQNNRIVARESISNRKWRANFQRVLVVSFTSPPHTYPSHIAIKKLFATVFVICSNNLYKRRIFSCTKNRVEVLYKNVGSFIEWKRTKGVVCSGTKRVRLDASRDNKRVEQTI